MADYLIIFSPNYSPCALVIDDLEPEPENELSQEAIDNWEDCLSPELREDIHAWSLEWVINYSEETGFTEKSEEYRARMLSWYNNLAERLEKELPEKFALRTSRWWVDADRSEH